MRKVLKNILRIYKRDMKKIATNWVAFIILCGLALLPSLYAWVNIWASWDPYSNTKGVKVGIVNEDKGTTLKGEKIHIGDGVVETLKKNNKLGWVFFNSAEEGKNAVEKGKVYATIIIPEDFSHKMGTVLDANPVKPKLEYYVNEKINAIAPKMTDSGASTLQKQISTTFTDTTVKKAFEILNKIGVELDDYYPEIEKYKYQLFEVDEKFPDLYKKIDKVIGNSQDGLVELDSKNEDIKDIQNILGKTIGFMDDMNKSLGDANQVVSDNSSQLKEDMALIQSILSSVSKITKESADSIVTKKPQVINDLNTTIQEIDDLNRQLDKLITRIENTSGEVSTELIKKKGEISDILKEDRELLVKLRNSIASGQEDLDPILTNLTKSSTDLANKIDELIPLVEQQIASTKKIISDLQKLNGDIGGLIPNADKVKENIETLTSQLETIKEKIPPVDTFKPVIGLIDKMIKDLKDNPDKIQDLCDSLKTLNDQLGTAISNLSSTYNSLSDYTETSLRQMQSTARAISKLCTNLQTTFNAGSRDTINKINSTLTRIDKADVDIKKILDKLSTSVNEDSANVVYDLRAVSPKLQELKKSLIELRDKIKSQDDVENLLYQINELTTNMDIATQKTLIKLNGDVLPTIERYLKNSAVFVLDLKNVMIKTNKNLDSLRDFLNRVNNKGKISVDELNDIKTQLPKVEKSVHDITEKIKEFEKTASLQEVIDLMKKDGNTEGGFISQSVELNTHKLFAMNNYGDAMTPFYSTLSLWVGALLLTALLSTKAINADFEFTPKEEFFGKYLMFGTFAFLQGLIVCLGDIFVLGVKAQQPVLLVCLGVFYSLVFTMIVYSLVSLFGNVGKAIGVVFMVVQLAGSGGTFPIEVTPKFFQIVYAILPFTYAISGMREAIGGVVYSTLIKDISVLLLYFVIFMVVGRTLKRSVNIILNKLSHKLGESGVVGH